MTTGSVGCASNLTLSESIVFSDATGHELDGYRIIEGGTLSGNFIPGASSYGSSMHTSDSIDGLQYLNFNPGMGYGYGLASPNFAAALTAQLFMLGADITVSPIHNLFFTGNLTTSGSFRFAALQRTSRSFAVGPFWRRDAFEAFVLGDAARVVKDMRYFADSFGFKGSLLFSASSESARILFLEAGYNPKIESIFLSIGMNGFRIH